MPFRTGSLKNASQTSIFRWSGVALAAASAVAILFIATGGLSSRFSPQSAAIGNYLDLTQQMGETCFQEGKLTSFEAKCTQPTPGQRNILLLGDSHAAMYWYGLNQVGSGTHIMQVTGAGCFPRLPPETGGYARSDCGKMWRSIFTKDLPSLKPDAVVVSGRWATPADIDEMDPLIQVLAGRNTPLYVLGPAPEFTAPLPLSLALGQKWGQATLSAPRPRPTFAALDRYAQQKFARMPGVVYLSAYQAMCGKGTCRYFADSDQRVPMMMDDNHLTNGASALLVREWARSGELRFLHQTGTANQN